MKQNKNIHVLPTDKSSRLYKLNIINKLVLLKSELKLAGVTISQNIYITNDEEIKGADYVIHNNSIYKVKENKGTYLSVFELNSIDVRIDLCKKIILTDNKELIKDGVQAIDDEFLEWFVKNPSCESIEVEKEQYHTFVSMKKYPMIPNYKIIIPKEEVKQGTMSEAIKQVISNQLKQETLEEAIKQELENHFFSNISEIKQAEYFINFGAKWQQEQDKNKFSEDDISTAIAMYLENKSFSEIIKQLKNK